MKIINWKVIKTLYPKTYNLLKDNGWFKWFSKPKTEKDMLKLFKELGYKIDFHRDKCRSPIKGVFSDTLLIFEYIEEDLKNKKITKNSQLNINKYTNSLNELFLKKSQNPSHYIDVISNMLNAINIDNLSALDETNLTIILTNSKRLFIEQELYEVCSFIDKKAQELNLFVGEKIL